MIKKKKRKYTFRKYTPAPYRSGSPTHEQLKRERKLYRETGNPLYEFVKVRKKERGDLKVYETIRSTHTRSVQSRMSLLTIFNENSLPVKNFFL